jgi:nucleotide sugar dehydrogenase
MTAHTIGFIGQGWIGKNYADSFEARGFNTVRYSNEKSYSANKEAIKNCDFVFIAVPTPTTPEGFDDSIVREVMLIVGKGKTAIIKSTIPPGTTKSIQKDNPEIKVLHNPEFLRESYARYDVDNPDRNIIGIPEDTEEYKDLAKKFLDILPKAKHNLICDSDSSEFIKYTHNTLGFSLIIFNNILYELATAYKVDWGIVKESIVENPWIPGKYLDPVHKGGRGAGGDCFIKDFAAFKALYEKLVANETGVQILSAYEQKNIELLLDSNKDLELLRGVYGDDIVTRRKK